MIPLTAHRHEHLARHRNTNQPDNDKLFEPQIAQAGNRND